MVDANSQDACPCGSGQTLLRCCGRYLHQARPVPSAESLMRSRYSAYVLADISWLLQTWHPSTRPPQLDLSASLADGTNWLDLQIVTTRAGRATDEQGSVEFIARYQQAGRLKSLHETSRFIREENKWYYVDGLIHPSDQVITKTGRNAACPCGSGKKYKRCCGR